MCEKKEVYNYLDFSFECSYNEYNTIKNKLDEYIECAYVKIIKCEFKENVSMVIKVVDFKLDYIKKVVDEIKYGN